MPLDITHNNTMETLSRREEQEIEAAAKEQAMRDCGETVKGESYAKGDGARRRVEGGIVFSRPGDSKLLASVDGPPEASLNSYRKKVC